jgi:ABC-type polysaccharide/polyol phosphate export permease
MNWSIFNPLAMSMVMMELVQRAWAADAEGDQ